MSEPFTVYVRREPSGSIVLTVRFEARKGQGLLHLRRGRGSSPRMQSVQEEADVSADELRAGRFVYQPSRDRPRQSFSLARLNVRELGALPEGQWIPLSPSIEHGFRYLLLDGVVPEPSVSVSLSDEGPNPPPSPAAAVAAVQAAPAPARQRTAAELLGLSRPRPVAKVNAEPGHTLPPAAAPAAMRDFDPPPVAAVGTGGDAELLKREVGRLRQQVELLQAQLGRAHARERDLIDLIAKWEDREI